MSRRLGPEEVSELAEALWDACVASEQAGITVHPSTAAGETCCPLGAAMGLYRYPGSDLAAKCLGIPRDFAESFARGFDSGRAGSSTPGRDLGRRFREQALGEGFLCGVKAAVKS